MENLDLIPETIASCSRKLKPAFDDLFDDIEEAMLLKLIDAGKYFLKQNRRIFSRLRLSEYKKKLKLAIHAIKLGNKNSDSDHLYDLFEANLKPSKSSTNYWEKQYYWKKVAKKHRTSCFSDILATADDRANIPSTASVDTNFEQQTRLNFFYFWFKQDFIDFVILQAEQEENKFMLDDLTAWIDIQETTFITKTSDYVKVTNKLKKKWFDENLYFFSNENSPATSLEQKRIINYAGGWKNFKKGVPRNDVLQEIQRVIRSRIEATSLPLYFASEQYKNYLKELKRLAKEAEKEKRREEKLNQTTSLSSTQPDKPKRKTVVFDVDSASKMDELQFRQAIQLPATQRKFYNYLADKGDLLANDLLFYIEVQKYKDFCHDFKSRKVLKAKIDTLIDRCVG